MHSLFNSKSYTLGLCLYDISHKKRDVVTYYLPGDTPAISKSPQKSMFATLGLLSIILLGSGI